MSDLTGLPDFQAPVSASGTAVFTPFGAGSHSVLAREFVVARDASGMPAFTLVMLKRADDLGAAGQYAVLDLALAGEYPLDDALAAARAGAVDATVKPVAINAGIARLYPASPAVALPPDLCAPVSLGMAGPGLVRWTARLALGSGELIRGALAGGTLLLGGRIDIEVIGVAPRVALTVQFTPGALVAAVLAGYSNRRIGTDDLLAFFKRPLGALPVKVVGSMSSDDARRFPAAMAGRLTAAYGRLVAAAEPTDAPLIELDAGADAATVNRSWNLSEPVAVPRYWSLSLDPLASLRAAAQGRDLTALVREVTVPPLAVGLWPISIAGNLPSTRVGVPAIGATVQVPAAPPLRPSAINQTMVFEAPGDTSGLTLHLAPDELLKYSLTTFALVTAGASVRRYVGAPRQLAETWVHLQGADFPVSFAHLTASDRLLKLADLSGTLRYTVDGQCLEQPLSLTAAAPDLAVAVPASASGAAIALSAIPKGGGDALALSPLVPGRLRLDVTSFREYGPHDVAIQCRFSAPDGLLALDLVAEDDVDNPAAMATVALMTSQPSAGWSYVASSPFRPGYRYRKAAASGESAGPWVAVAAPFEPLLLAPDGTRIAAASSGATADVAFDIDGIHFYAKPDDPGTLYYLPAAPSPERDGQSPPKLTLIRTAQTAILQLGARFSLGDAELAAAQAKIAAARPEFASARLQPAPITVRAVSVLLSDAAGNPQELKRAMSSGYPPYAAIFSITLAPDQAAQVTAAINGRSGLLFVDYAIDIPDEVSATLDGAPSRLVRRTDVASWFPGGAGTSHLLLAG